MSNRPLPDGWIQQYDPKYDHPFWVDTRSNPSRAIWVHPLEDEQFLSEHPELRPRDDAPPSYDIATAGHASGSGEKPLSELPDSDAGPSSHVEHKRGMFGRLKDKAIGTKEEREEHKRIRAEQAARARRRELEEREAYMRAHGGYAPYHPSYSGQYPAQGPAPGLGTDNNAAVLLLGGLAGGLLLGDIFGGGGF